MTSTNKPYRYPRSMPWWRSRVIVGSLVAMVAAILRQTGLVHAIAPEAVTQWTDWILLLTSLVGGGVAVHGRIDQDTAPKITGGKRP